MKKKFSKHWKSSIQPRKQRKYIANAPLHIKRKFLSTNLSKELRKKYGKRNIPLKKGDVVKIIKGKFKGKQGKVNEIKTKALKVFVEGMQIKKQDGSKANVPLKPANLQIVELNLDSRRSKSLAKTKETKDKKTEIKVVEKKEETKEKKEIKEKPKKEKK
jgi:large subunit ribosomal protein L24